MQNFDKNRSHYTHGNRKSYDFLSKHIELSEYQKNRVFLGGRIIGKTSSMYMILIVEALKKPNEITYVTEELLRDLDRPERLEQVIKRFNFFCTEHFDRMFMASKDCTGMSYRMAIKTDYDKLKNLHPEMLV